MKVRDTDLHQVVSRAVVIATGITANGDRELLAEQHDNWATHRRYLSEASMARLDA